MAINAVIRSPVRINANTSQLVSSQSQPPITLKNSISAGAAYLSQLQDVSVQNPVGGEVLTYNAQTGLYDLEPVSITNNTIDGGTF